MYRNGKYFCKNCRVSFERAESYSIHSCVETKQDNSVKMMYENISEDLLFVGKDQENLKADGELHSQTIRNQFNDGQRSLYLAIFFSWFNEWKEL